jgi:hypothetical protein
MTANIFIDIVNIAIRSGDPIHILFIVDVQYWPTLKTLR